MYIRGKTLGEGGEERSVQEFDEIRGVKLAHIVIIIDSQESIDAIRDLEVPG